MIFQIKIALKNESIRILTMSDIIVYWKELDDYIKFIGYLFAGFAAIISVTLAMLRIQDTWLTIKKKKSEIFKPAKTRKLIRKNKFTNTNIDDKLIVYKDQSKVISLVMDSNGVKCKEFDQNNNGSSNVHWILDKTTILNILENDDIQVTSNMLSADAGIYSIGREKENIYSTDIHSNPTELKQNISNLLNDYVKT